jgi:tetraether lipid synthase
MNDEVFLAATQSVCPECLRTIPAVRLAKQEEIVLRKECPEHGRFESVIWRGRPDYVSWQRPKTPARPACPQVGSRQGCPRDCGLCSEHRQHTCTALIEVTRRCDLRCTYCFADGGDGRLPDPSLDDLGKSFEQLLRAGGPYNIQLSGGEPTLRDDLPEIAGLGRSLGFEFIQVNTNGRRLGRDPDYAGILKEAGVASVFLQFDGVEDTVYEKLRGQPLVEEKRRAVEHCSRHGLAVVLVPTLVPGVNDRQIGAIIDFGLQHSPTVRGVHFQPVSYFGRIPAPPDDGNRLTIPEILREIEAQTGGRIKVENFKPPGCENAWCSFHGNFVFLEDGALLPWTRHVPCCTPEAAAAGALKTRHFVSRSWAPAPKGETDLQLEASGPSLGGWDRVLERARSHTFCISGMAFQDAWNLDLERLKDCCIHVVHPDGRLIPFCAYNLTDRQGRALYRTGSGAASDKLHQMA